MSSSASDVKRHRPEGHSGNRADGRGGRGGGGNRGGGHQHDGRGRGGGGGRGGSNQTAGRGGSTGAGSSSSSAATSTPFVLPKDVLGMCNGQSVLLVLADGNEMTGTLEQADVDTGTVLLSNMTHWRVAATTTTPANAACNNNRENEDVVDGGDRSALGGSSSTTGGPRQLQRVAVLRQTRRALVAGHNVVAMIPNPRN